MVEIRKEQNADVPLVRELNSVAFPGGTEAGLVDVLRETAGPLISLVAVEHGAVVGHIMFTPVELSGDPARKIMGLAPMAVSPSRQRHGIGTRLVEEGLERCREIGAGAVVVLGHTCFYPRFGFEPASKKNIDCEFDAPADAFMIIELSVDYLSGAGGTISYHDAFADTA